MTPDAQTPQASATPGTIDPAPTPPQQPISAKAGSYFRNMRYLFVVAMLALGGWFSYDGWVAYPAHNAKVDDVTAQRDAAEKAGNDEQRATLDAQLKELGDKWQSKDIALQRILGFILPPLALILLARWIHVSRGLIRLENDTLHVPGHPPVPIGSITHIDNRSWSRKGIDYVHYKLDNGQSGVLKLDDFVYDRKPIDDIHDILAARRSEILALPEPSSAT